jgi:hypothetical protein
VQAHLQFAQANTQSKNRKRAFTFVTHDKKENKKCPASQKLNFSTAQPNNNTT